MRLSTFQIQSYRSCVKTEIHFDPDLTVLIGINSAGKSNFLSAVQLLKKIFNSSTDSIHRKDSNYNKCMVSAKFEHKKKFIYMKGLVVYGTDERNVDDVHYAKLKWNLKEFTNRNEWKDFPLRSDSFEYHIMSNDQAFLRLKNLTKHDLQLFEMNQIKKDYLYYRKVEQPIIANVVNFIEGINYYSASQFSDPSRCPVSIEFEEERPMRRFRSNLGHEKFVLDLYKAWKKKDAQYKRYVNTINKTGIGLIDDVNFSEIQLPSSSCEVLSGGKLRKIEKMRSIVIPTFTVEGSTLSPNQLSEGTFKTLALLFYVLTDESKLLIIEEPEVCVHHGLLNSIITIVKAQSRSKQIIISTHSDFVLDYMEPRNLILVKRDAKTGTVAKSLLNSLSKNNFQALKEYLKETGSLGEYWKEEGFENEI